MSLESHPIILNEKLVSERAESLFRVNERSIHERTDRLFMALMAIQWVACVAAAVWVSPRTWAGAESEIHVHVWAATLLGGLLCAFPALLAWKTPGAPLTRHVTAVSQMAVGGAWTTPRRSAAATSARCTT